MRICRWDYCRTTIPKYSRRCPEHRDMKWWQEYAEHVKHLCWEEEEIPLDEIEDALDIVHASREQGGPKEAALRLEAEHGIDPTLLIDAERL